MVRAAILAALAMVSGCAASEAEVRDARTSGYSADYAIVYSEVLAAVRELYPHVNENASAGTVKTGWHPVKIRTGTNDLQDNSGQVNDPNAPPQLQGNPTFQSGALGRKQYFIRFTVAVIGGKPWRVRVEGQASSWDIAGGVPTQLKGAETPAWLEGRTAALQVAIHQRLKKYAVRLKYRKPVGPKHDKTDLAKYGNVPAGAAQLVSRVHRAAVDRNPEALRTSMIDEFSWSGGSAPSADVAIAMWQADSTLLGELAKVLEAGCRIDDSRTLVTCPPAYTEEPSYRGYRAGFKVVDGRWRMTFFMNGEN
jgi:hypothetical protein